MKTPDVLAAHQCPTPCDPDCTALCHELHHPVWKREHDPMVPAAPPQDTAPDPDPGPVPDEDPTEDPRAAPVALIGAASAAMRINAYHAQEASTGGGGAPWRIAGPATCECCDVIVDNAGRLVMTYDDRYSALIAGMHPGTALSVAGLLERVVAATDPSTHPLMWRAATDIATNYLDAIDGTATGNASSLPPVSGTAIAAGCGMSAGPRNEADMPARINALRARVLAGEDRARRAEFELTRLRSQATDRLAFEHDIKPELVEAAARAPGEVLAAVVGALRITQTEFARRTGYSLKHVNQLIKGRARITYEVAVVLERHTWIRAAQWNALEAAYRTRLLRERAGDEHTRLSQQLTDPSAATAEAGGGGE